MAAPVSSYWMGGEWLSGDLAYYGSASAAPSGTGIFAIGGEAFGYRHVSLRVIPAAQEYWPSQPVGGEPSNPFVNDENGKWFATIGAAPSTKIPPCTGIDPPAFPTESDLVDYYPGWRQPVPKAKFQ